MKKMERKTPKIFTGSAGMMRSRSYVQTSEFCCYNQLMRVR